MCEVLVVECEECGGEGSFSSGGGLQQLRRLTCEDCNGKGWIIAGVRPCANSLITTTEGVDHERTCPQI